MYNYWPYGLIVYNYWPYGIIVYNTGPTGTNSIILALRAFISNYCPYGIISNYCPYGHYE